MIEPAVAPREHVVAGGDGGWNIMANIGGHAGDYSGIQKYKLRWIRDDQVDVVSQPGASTHAITPLETPGGTKIVVIRTGLSTAYVAELRTKLGVDGLDNRARYQGVLLYRINTSLTGLDSQAALWGPGDTFTDPATGVKIDFGDITHRNAADPANSPYTADDTAAMTVTKTSAAALSQPVTLSQAKLTSPTMLHVDTSVELQRRIADSNAINNGHFVYVREESPIKPSDVVLTRADGSAVPVAGVTINPDSLDIALAPGAFPSAASAQGLKLATKAFYYFAAAAPVKVTPQLLDVGATVPAQLSLSLGAPASFGAFAPGVAIEYTAQTTANVTSTAGDATLGVSDPGHLTNGAFSLPEALRVEIAPASWTGPVSNAGVAITFRQHIGASDALRTGSYSKALTFTLSTTTP